MNLCLGKGRQKDADKGVGNMVVALIFLSIILSLVILYTGFNQVIRADGNHKMAMVSMLSGAVIKYFQ